MSPVASVLIPTFDHGELIRFAVQSVLRQTVSDLEVFIVGDGATPSTKDEARALEAEYSNVRFFDNPKGPRRGERHRHNALQDARGEFVFYLSDQDIWLPDHVETMLVLLQRANFVGGRQMRVLPDGRMLGWPMDTDNPYFVRKMLAGQENYFGISSAAHRLDFYRQLPHGWRTTPDDVWTDLYMWQQFLEHPACVFALASYPTVLTFSASDRPQWTVEERIRESLIWQERVTRDGRLSVERIYHDGIFKIAAELHVKSRTLDDKVCVLNEALAAKQEEIEQLRGDAQQTAANMAAIKARLHAMEHSATFRASLRVQRLPLIAPVLAMAIRIIAGREKR